MTLTNESLELLKTDTSGRVRTTPERREALLDEFERSGLSGMRFEALHGLTYPTFASWAARRRKERMGMEEQKAGPTPCAPRGAAAPVKPVRCLEAVTEDGMAFLFKFPLRLTPPDCQFRLLIQKLQIPSPAFRGPFHLSRARS